MTSVFCWTMAGIAVSCVCFSLFSFAHAFQVSFELVNSDVNKVIFVGEKNITMRCSVIGTADIIIRTLRIYDQIQRVVAQNMLGENRLEYTIDEVSLSDVHAGLYTCGVQFNTKDSKTVPQNVRENATMLYLNVRKGGPQCFRNGTEGTPYQNGDRLSMSCYCKTMEPCGWIKMIDGRCFSLPQLTKTFTHRSKTIYQVIDEYSSSDPNSISYVCRNAVLSKQASQSCIVGPQSKSSCDAIITDGEDALLLENTDSSHQSQIISSDFLCDIELLQSELYQTKIRSISSGIKIFSITIISLFMLTVFVIFVVVTSLHLRESCTPPLVASQDGDSIQHTYDTKTYSSSLNTYELAK